MKENEYQGDQLFGDDVPSYPVRPPYEEGSPVPAEDHSLYRPDGSPIDEITPYQYNRARRLEHVLSRIEQSEQVYDHYHPQGWNPSIVWIDSEGKHKQDINPQLIQAMRGIAVTLFADLKAEGEEALAIDLVDQHRPPMDDGETPTTPELP